MATIYDFSLKDKKGNDVSLEQYEDNLVGRDGSVLARFEPTMDMALVEEKVKEALAQ